MRLWQRDPSLSNAGAERREAAAQQLLDELGCRRKESRGFLNGAHHGCVWPATGLEGNEPASCIIVMMNTQCQSKVSLGLAKTS